MIEKENAPSERDVQLERIIRGNFSDEELADGGSGELDKLVVKGAHGTIYDVARYFQRVNNRLKSKRHYGKLLLCKKGNRR